jgi:hypothetical protein
MPKRSSPPIGRRQIEHKFTECVSETLNIFFCSLSIPSLMNELYGFADNIYLQS